MQRLKKGMRLIGLICLITLAAIGVSLGGGVPIISSRRQKSKETQIELVETMEKESALSNEVNANENEPD